MTVENSIPPRKCNGKCKIDKRWVGKRQKNPFRLRLCFVISKLIFALSRVEKKFSSSSHHVHLLNPIIRIQDKILWWTSSIYCLCLVASLTKDIIKFHLFTHVPGCPTPPLVYRKSLSHPSALRRSVNLEERQKDKRNAWHDVHK